ncbi:type II secretion system protein B [Shewanella psychrophila]|uniref:Type II secretion system protein B n=1 Tax=Shewanella psychrophila TaxID=225848 RepID=A0A1S6HQ85_9GAMM|nr:general secretion pathway protein GspB [Shewanella psychrophila]AQS37693.1 type II secretion system protein B [Shewanella psychrophila]
MSILLDAVTRAKNQELDTCIDPVLTPRAQYDNFSGNSQRNLTILFGVLILLLLVIIAWLGRGYLMNDSRQLSELKLTPVPQQELQVTPATSSQDISLKSEQSVRLAGKVALPVATERPIAERYVDNRVKSQHTESNGYVDNRISSSQYIEPSGYLETTIHSTEASTTALKNSSANASSNSSASEPIILGAHPNQKGQDMLAALKLEVNQAASEVGLETTSATPKNYQDENNLLAAFEAALNAVEVEKSLASPMTALELDPIPATKSDTLPKYGQLPAGLQLQVPEFNINAHVYSTDPDNRWLNVDGAELQEGDSIGGKLDIVEIRPRDVVLAIQGTKFKVPAI